MTRRWGRWLKKTNHPWLKRVWRKVYCQNGNYIFFIYGDPGSGKSEAGLALGEMYSPRFGMQHVVFSVRDFVNLLDSDVPKQGDYILFEEIGSEAGNRDYFTVDNKIMSRISQTIRTKNLIVGYTAPRLEMADKQILALCMGLIHMNGVDFRTSKGLARIYDNVKFNMKTDDWVKRLVRVRRPSLINPKRSWSLKIGTTRIHRASVHLRHLYEKVRSDYTKRITSQSKLAFEHKDAQEAASNQIRSISQQQINDWADEVIRNRLDFMDEMRFNLPAVQNHFSKEGQICSSATAKKIKERVRSEMKRLNYAVLWR
jgi:hypothetical protein